MGFPNLPGVPPRKSTTIATAATLAAPAINLLLDLLKPKWLILNADGHTVALAPDSFLGIDYKAESNVSTYPIEQGAFNSYNKVKSPFNAIIKVSKGSSLNMLGNNSNAKSRSDFIATLESMADDRYTYIIKTPEKTYTNVNLVGHDYRRGADSGSGILIVNLHFVQIMNAQLLVKPTSVKSVLAAPGSSPFSVQPTVSCGQLSAQLAQPFTGAL